MTTHATRRRLTTYMAGAIAACLAEAPARAADPLPTDITVPAGNELFLVGHAVGTQNYTCVAVPSDAGLAFSWVAFGPQATLFNDRGAQLTTHFLSANPDENGKARPTWQSSKDTSAVWGEPIASTTDGVESGAVPWLLLRVVGVDGRPTGSRHLARATFIQRINTSGGVAPATGCAEPKNVGDKALVPYSTDYLFFRAK
jgi:hypothetical protein